jgi:hypothetical protein
MKSRLIENAPKLNINSIDKAAARYIDKYNNIGIVKQAVNFGGYRYYFQCNYCNRKVKDLYYTSKGVLACRHCLKLNYFCCIYRNMKLENHYKTYHIKNKIKKLRDNRHKKRAFKLELKLFPIYEKAKQEIIDFTSLIRV